MALAQVSDLLQALLGRANSYESLANAPMVEKQIQQLEILMVKQEEEHQHALREVEHALENGIPVELRSIVNQKFDAAIDEIVAEETEKCLEQLAGVRAQNEVLSLRKALREKQILLHNTEARRENSLLREKDEEVPLRKLQRSDGTVHDLFPATVKELRNMPADPMKQLMAAYRVERSSSPGGEVNNMNRLLQHFGLKGCLVTPM